MDLEIWELVLETFSGGQKNVDEGGNSSFAKSSRKLRDTKDRGEEE